MEPMYLLGRSADILDLVLDELDKTESNSNDKMRVLNVITVRLVETMLRQPNLPIRDAFKTKVMELIQGRTTRPD